MAYNVERRSRQWIPGPGFDTSGTPKQGKTRVVGEINVTSYSGSSGEQLAPKDVGLTTVDYLDLKVADEQKGHLDGSRRQASYSRSTGHFYLFTVSGTGAVASYASAGTETVVFVAEGDAADDVELT